MQWVADWTDSLGGAGWIPRARGTSSESAPPLLVLTALAVAGVGQGGYYLGPRTVVAILLVGAAVATGWGGLRVWPLGRPVYLSLAAVAVWSVASGVLAGHPAGSVPTVVLVGCLAVVMSVAASATRAWRDALAVGVIGLGALIALSGWLGVAFRETRWAHVDGGLWRAATTVTYANAAAAVLVPLALLTLAIVTAHPAALGRCVCLLLLVGVGATLSRAAIASLFVGWCVLAGLLGVRVVAATAQCLLGAGLAMAALLPSVPSSSGPGPGWAALGLAAGLMVAAAPSVGARWWIAGLLVAAGVVGPLVVARGLPDGRAWRSVTASRLSVSSPDRASAARSAMSLVRRHPVTGVGPGRATLFWVSPQGQLVTDSYVHDEYLQVAAEQGAVGVVLLVALFAVVARKLGAGHRNAPGRPMWAGALAGVISVAVQSGFDFLWHVPVVPLVAALLAGLAFPISEYPTEGG